MWVSDLSTSSCPGARVAGRWLLLLVLLGILLLGTGGPAGAQERAADRVLVTTVDGPITPVVADHLADVVARAERGGHRALIVRIDTPGGLETSMRSIVQRFLAADVPVVVYVSPDGARAASAGAIITFAAHIAAMAPGTAMGASTPVDLEGGDAGRKAVNDSAAFAESIAQVRGRNVEFAVATVREGRSASAREALELGAVDLVVASLPQLLDEIDGRQVVLAGDRTTTLATAGAAVEEAGLGVLRRIQQILADPNLAFLFLSLGTLAIMYELANPGIGAGGAVGVILIVLAMFALAVLPVTAAGLILLALAVALFVAELFAPGVGVAAASGTVALVLSGIFLFRDTPGLEVSLAVIIPIAAVVGVAVVGAGHLAVRSRDVTSITSPHTTFVGQVLTVQGAAGGRGQAFVEGAWWNVRSDSGPLEDGMTVRVVDIDGLDLVVTDVSRPSEHPQTGAT